MNCPRCKGNQLEVLETRHTSSTVRRRRRCLNPHCEHRFTTTESTATATKVPLMDETAVRARALAQEFGSKKMDREALLAALTTDMRRAQIARQQRAERRAQRDVWVDNDDGFDRAPDRLTDEALKRELGEY